MTPYFTDDSVTLWHGDSLDVLRGMPDGSVDSCITSPPYFGLRDYGEDGQYGLEASPAEYVERMQTLFAEVQRVLAADGTLWVNLGDSYSTPKRGSDKGWDKSRLTNPGRVQKMQFASMREGREISFDRERKNLLGIPWRVAFALQDDGWTLRNAIIWHKPNAMPEPVTDRFASDYEHLFLFSKSRFYWFDLEAAKVPCISEKPPGNSAESLVAYGQATGTQRGSRRFGGNPTSTLLKADREKRNPGSVWDIPTQPFAAAHFAVMPRALAERCVLAGCKQGGTVLDPFSGSGTTGLAAARHGRKYVGIDISREYLDMSLRTRLAQPAMVDEETA